MTVIIIIMMMIMTIFAVHINYAMLLEQKQQKGLKLTGVEL